MPDGTSNDRDCRRGTRCCPTCDETHPCGSGQVCCDGRCQKGVCATSDWTHLFNIVPQSISEFAFAKEIAVTPDGQTICVASGNSVVVYTRQGGSWTRVGIFGAVDIQSAWGVGVAADGQTVWVADQGYSQITIWTRGGSKWNLVAYIGNRAPYAEDGFYRPKGLALAAAPSATLWVADSLNRRISVWKLRGGSWTHETNFGSPGGGDNQFGDPRDVAAAADGQAIWVLDHGNKRISVWRLRGSTWMHETNFGSFSELLGVAAAPDGQIVWVSEGSADKRISVWKLRDGSWTRDAVFGSRGVGAAEFMEPWGVAVAADGQTVFVGDPSNLRVSVWRQSGATGPPRPA